MIRVVSLKVERDGSLQGTTTDGRRIVIRQRPGWLSVTAGIQDIELKKNEGNILRLKTVHLLSFEEIIGVCTGVIRFF